MQLPPTSAITLENVTELMRELSRLTDPEDAADLYGEGLRKFGLVPNDRYLSLSRRDLKWPQYRITRNSSWTEHPNPWLERHKLPLLSGGILAEALYSNTPAIISDLKATVKEDDPAHPYLSDMELLVGLPHFDRGESINMGCLLSKSAEGYPLASVPLMIWMANLWGRATLNLVNQQKLKVAYQSLDRELKVVGEIQKSLLPRELPRIEGVEMAVHYQTSQRAGGDYYDFFPLPEGQWGIFVADVSGHGTPAAVMMAITHAIAHSHPGHPCPPSDVLRYLNNKLANLYTVGTGTFITALYGVLDAGKRTLRIASAGHPLPRLVREGKGVAIEEKTGLPLGISPDEVFAEQVVELRRGDKLLLFTDGITEAMDSERPENELFGEARLDAVACGKFASAGELLSGVLNAVEAFTKGTAPTDDRTLLAMVFE